jgi:hypothetical protein
MLARPAQEISQVATSAHVGWVLPGVRPSVWLSLSARAARSGIAVAPTRGDLEQGYQFASFALLLRDQYQ